MLSIAVATKNGEKLKAVEKAFREVFCLHGKQKVKVTGHSSQSGIEGGQPFELAGIHHACTSRLAYLKSDLKCCLGAEPDYLVVVENGILTTHTTGDKTRYIDLPEVWVECTSTGERHIATGVGREIDYEMLKDMELQGKEEGLRGEMVAWDFEQRGLGKTRAESIHAATVMCLRQFDLPDVKALRVPPVSPVTNKSNQAQDLMLSLVGKNGVWASSHRYRHQNWTRDFVLCTSWVFLHHPALKDFDLVGKHLLHLASFQAKDGKVPIVVPDDEKAMVEHMEDIKTRTDKAPYALVRYRSSLDDFLNITPNTRDSELLFLLLAQPYKTAALLESKKDVATRLDKPIRKAWQYVASLRRRSRTQTEDEGLILGGDWRDTCYELEDKPTLTNACVLYHLCMLNDLVENAEGIKEYIHKNYWLPEQGYFGNYPKAFSSEGKDGQVPGFKAVFPEQTPVRWDECDRLGNAYAILFDVATPEQAGRALTYLTTKCKTKYGIEIGGVYLPPKNDEERQVIQRDGTQIWPFVHNKVITALIHHQKNTQKMKCDTLCTVSPRELFEPMVKLTGFHEWYDLEGRPHGSSSQTWSAATFLEVEETLKNY